MQLRENYGKNKKYFWLYSIVVFAAALLAVWVLGARAASTDVTPASVTPESARPVPPPSAVAPPPSGPLGQGIVPGRKDDTDGTRDPSR